MADHRKVIAPVGVQFSPLSLNHPHNERLRSVSHLESMTYGFVKTDLPELAAAASVHAETAYME